MTHGGFALQDVCNRTLESARQAAAFIGAGRPVSDYANLERADIFFIGVPDDRISQVCDALVSADRLQPESIVFHCSGALSSSALRTAVDQGAAVASIHPIRSFAAPEKIAEDFAGTWCGMEGDQAALDVLIPAFTSIGAQLVSIKPEAKIHYHAAAVFACNYLVTLLDVAQQSYARAGIAPDIALKLMAPLVRETVENVFRLGPEAALTGPIARGDLATANQQWRAVNDADAAHGGLYKQLMDLTVTLAARRQT